MHSPVLKAKKKSPHASLQTKFNQYRRKIEQLRHQQELLREECEEALVFFHTTLKPKEKETTDLITKFLLRLIEITEKPGSLTKKEREVFDMFASDVLDTFLILAPTTEFPEKIKALFRQVKGFSIEEFFSQGLSLIQEQLREITGFEGLDLSKCNLNDSPEDIMLKLTQSMESIKEKFEHESISEKSKNKTKKELFKEQKALELEAIQSKNLNNIYKRLAKILHPDFEQDPAKKEEKVFLMKRLTVAYEERDLMAILNLEAEWLGTVEESMNGLTEENLKIYNSLLKDQIEELKQELSMVSSDPRYFEIARDILEYPDHPMKGMKGGYEQCREIQREYTKMLSDISGKDSLITLKKILKNLPSHLEEDLLFDMFFDDDDDDDDVFLDFSKVIKPSKTRKKR